MIKPTIILNNFLSSKMLSYSCLRRCVEKMMNNREYWRRELDGNLTAGMRTPYGDNDACYICMYHKENDEESYFSFY